MSKYFRSNPLKLFQLLLKVLCEAKQDIPLILVIFRQEMSEQKVLAKLEISLLLLYLSLLHLTLASLQF